MNPTEDELPQMESVELSGHVIAALAQDSELKKKSGALVRTRVLAKEYGITDIDGRQVEPSDYPEFQL